MAAGRASHHHSRGLRPRAPLTRGQGFHQTAHLNASILGPQDAKSSSPNKVQVQLLLPKFRTLLQIQQQPSKGHGGATATGITGMQMPQNTRARTCLVPVGRAESSSTSLSRQGATELKGAGSHRPR